MEVSVEYPEEGLLSWAEIARILDMPVTSVKHQYASAIRKLRQAMLDEGVSEQEFAHYLYLRFQNDKE